MNRLLILILITLVSGLEAKSQSDTSLLIRVWGSEPFWRLELDAYGASYNSGSGVDKNQTFSIPNTISPEGFSDENVSTYLLTGAKGESAVLILVRNEECACAYDMSDGKSKLSAYFYLEIDKRKILHIGCASKQYGK